MTRRKDPTETRIPLAEMEAAGHPLLHFEPVPRKPRHDGWTPERQRAFIGALADTGSVKRAAAHVNMSAVGAYWLRRQSGSEGLPPVIPGDMTFASRGPLPLVFIRSTAREAIADIRSGIRCSKSGSQALRRSVSVASFERWICSHVGKPNHPPPWIRGVASQTIPRRRPCSDGHTPRVVLQFRLPNLPASTRILAP